MPEQTIKWLKRFLRLGLALLLLALIVLSIDFNELKSLPALAVQPLLIGFVALCIAMFIFALRWSIIVNPMLTEPIRVIDYFVYASTAAASGIVLPQTASTIFVKASLLKQHTTLTFQRGMMSVVVDKLHDLSVVLSMLGVVMLYLVKQIDLDFLIVLVIGFHIGVNFMLLFAYDLWFKLIKVALHYFDKLFEKLQYLRKKVPLDFAQLFNLKHSKFWLRRNLISCYWLTLLGEVFLVLRSFFIAQSVGLDVPITLVLVGVVITQASLFIALTPSGLGVIEGAWFLAFRQAGSDVESIVAFLIVHRLVGIAAIVMLWLGGLLIQNSTKKASKLSV